MVPLDNPFEKNENEESVGEPEEDSNDDVELMNFVGLLNLCQSRGLNAGT